MQRLFLLVAVMLLSGCLTAPPKEAARPTLMPRAQSYKDLTHLPAPTGKIFVSVYNIQDETGQFKPYPASNFSTAVPQSATAISFLCDTVIFAVISTEAGTSLTLFGAQSSIHIAAK